MKCELIQDLLPSYLDGSCSDETKKIVDEHIGKCENCKRIIDEINEVDSLNQPTIDETKPFKKIKNSHRKTILVLSILFVCFFFLFGTRLNSEIVKLRFQLYTKMHYPNEELIMTDFEYRDPETQGFGINNGFYIASFETTNKDEKDMKFNVFTDGFIFTIKDTYKNSVENRSNTNARLLEEYSLDVKKSLLKQKDFYLINVLASNACNEDYFVKNISKKIELNMEYNKNIDQTLPINLLLEVNADENDVSDIKSYSSKIINKLHEAGYHPCKLSLIIETEKDTYRTSDINCNSDISQQKIEFVSH